MFFPLSVASNAFFTLRVPFLKEIGKRHALGRYLLLPALYFVLALFFSLFQPLIALLLATLNTSRRLGAAEESALSKNPFFQRKKEIRVVSHPHAFVRVFFGGAAACAISNTIFLFEEQKKPTISVVLLHHEAVHIMQYERFGFGAFLGLYFAFTIYDWIRLKSAAKAYAANPFEREARRGEKKAEFPQIGT
jgi:hypothetical protein